jgi:hypothetical protein
MKTAYQSFHQKGSEIGTPRPEGQRPITHRQSPFRPTLRLPADTTEILRLCPDQLIVEAAMRHLIREYEPFEEDAGEMGGDL